MYKYFFFSLDQMKEREDTYDRLNKRFVPGTVIYNGTVYEFTCSATTPSLPRFPDARLVAEGEESTMQVVQPKGVRRGLTS